MTRKVLPQQDAGERSSALAVCLLLAVMTCAAYWQSLQHPFIAFDDTIYVVENGYVRSGLSWENVLWAFTTTHAANWHPLTWLSHMLDCQLFGLDPRGHHLTNLLLHLASTLLLFLLLLRLTGAMVRSFLVAALFALHPLHVESVAWVAERKDVLSGFFFLATLHLYVSAARSLHRGLYWGTFCLFIAGLLAKPMLVTLPLVMVLLDYWPLRRFAGGPTDGRSGLSSRRWRELAREKIPFLAAGVLSSIITIYAQHAGKSLASIAEASLPLRLANATAAYGSYLVKTVVPRGLVIFYPLRQPPVWQVAGSVIAVGTISYLAWRHRHRFPYVLTGWLWYLVTLVPVIGLVQVGDQAVADRYTYLPLIGLFIVVSWGSRDVAGTSRRGRAAFVAVTAAAAVGSLLLTWRQLSHWKSDSSLFSHALDSTRDNYKVHHALGIVLAKEGRFAEGLPHLKAAAAIVPDAAVPRYDLGVALEAAGKSDAAALSYSAALGLNPAYVEAHTQLGGVLCRQGRFPEAFAHFSTALQLDPHYEAAVIDRERCRRSMGPAR